MASPEHCRKEFDKVSRKRGRNTKFDELCALLEMHGWTLHQIAKNNHYVFVHSGYEGTVNIPKPRGGGDVLPVYCRHALQAIEEVAGYE